MSHDNGEGLSPMAFVSRALSDAETRYPANELECLVVVWALKKLRPYVYGRRFMVQTDTSAIRWMMSKKELTGKFARWILSLQESIVTLTLATSKDQIIRGRCPIAQHAVRG